MSDTAMVLVAVCLIILGGFYLHQIWISLIFAVAAVAYLLVSGKPAPKRASGGAPAGPKVQPIIIRRNYTGPKSIYPDSMTIYRENELPSDWREYGPEAVGKVIGKGAKWIGRLFD